MSSQSILYILKAFFVKKLHHFLAQWHGAKSSEKYPSNMKHHLHSSHSFLPYFYTLVVRTYHLCNMVT